MSDVHSGLLEGYDVWDDTSAPLLNDAIKVSTQSVMEADVLVRFAMLGHFDKLFYRQYAVLLDSGELLLFGRREDVVDGGAEGESAPNFRYRLDQRHGVTALRREDFSRDPGRAIWLDSFTLYERSLLTSASRGLGTNGLKLLELAVPHPDHDQILGRMQESIERVARKQRAKTLSWLMPTWMPPTA